MSSLPTAVSVHVQAPIGLGTELKKNSLRTEHVKPLSHPGFEIFLMVRILFVAP